MASCSACAGCTTRSSTPTTWIPWRFRREFWGQGYATEAAAAWVHHAFAVIGVTRVISMADEENSRSPAVMARLGMAFDHEADISDDGLSLRVQVWVAVPQPA